MSFATFQDAFNWLEKKSLACPEDAFRYPRIGFGSDRVHEFRCRSETFKEALGRKVVVSCTRKAKHAGEHHAHDPFDKCVFVWMPERNEVKEEVDEDFFAEEEAWLQTTA